MTSGDRFYLKFLMKDLFLALKKHGKSSDKSSTVEDYLSYCENISTCQTSKVSFAHINERLCAFLRDNGRDLDCVRLRALTKLFSSLPSVRRKAELLEFLLNMASCQSLDKNGTENLFFDNLKSGPFISNSNGGTGLLTSGYNSGLNTQTTIQKQAMPRTEYPLSETKISQPPTTLPPTAPSLTSLWGVPNPESSKRHLSSQSINRRPMKPQPAKRSTTNDSRSTVSENDLLRELLFVLNGIGGTLIKFDSVQDAFSVSPDLGVLVGQQDMICRIAQCGWLHNQIRQFVNRTRADKTAGAMIQSFASALHKYLTEYYRLVATLEAQLNQESQQSSMSSTIPSDITSLSAESNNGLSSIKMPSSSSMGIAFPEHSSNQLSSDTSQHMTLTRLNHWTHEPRHLLKFVASLCDVCKGLKGGALASEIYAYTLHGDPEVAQMMRTLLASVAKTLLHYISLWIYDGQLDDPSQEFFVASNSNVKTNKLWHDKYSLRSQMIPNFITPSQARKILLTGKSINFLIHACGEKRGIKDREAVRQTRLKQVELIFDQDIDPAFDHMISTVYKQTSRYLLETLIDRYHFLDHLRATRQFLLLGQGDFIQHLMDLLDADLSRPAGELSTHRLSNTLETAIRDTNAQYEEPEILQRLDVRLLEVSTDDTGWDVFSLEYHVDGPLATIFTDDCRLMYLRAFNFLWRAKRMEFLLSNLWKHQLNVARLGHELQADLAVILHLTQLLSAEIRHFIQQLQYYINFEVLECGWETLVKQIHSATDLDNVISAHKNFLSNVITRCLLDAKSRQLLGQLRTIFNLIINFSQLHQNFVTTALTEFGARERNQREIQRSIKTGKWGTDEAKEEQERMRRRQFVERNLGPLQAQIRIQASTYRANVIKFIGMLSIHPDQSLRYLSEHLNFNGHYYHTLEGSESGGTLRSSAPTFITQAKQLSSSVSSSGAWDSQSRLLHLSTDNQPRAPDGDRTSRDN